MRKPFIAGNWKMYTDADSAAALAKELASKLAGVIASEEMKALDAMSAESGPRLVTACAEDDRIVVSSRGNGGLGSLLGSIVSGTGLGTFGRVLDHVHQVGTAAHAGVTIQQ